MLVALPATAVAHVVIVRLSPVAVPIRQQQRPVDGVARELVLDLVEDLGVRRALGREAVRRANTEKLGRVQRRVVRRQRGGREAPARGFAPKGTTHAEILHEIENELTGDAVERPLLLTDGDGDGRKPDDDYVSDGGESE